MAPQYALVSICCDFSTAVEWIKATNMSVYLLTRVVRRQKCYTWLAAKNFNTSK